MYVNVLIMMVRMLKMVLMYVEDDGKNVEDDSKSDSIENGVCWWFDETSEYKGWVIKLDFNTPVKF